MLDYISHRFRRKELANKKRIEMKKEYGYLPALFKVTNPNSGKIHYSVIQPKGLKRIR